MAAAVLAGADADPFGLIGGSAFIARGRMYPSRLAFTHTAAEVQLGEVGLSASGHRTDLQSEDQQYQHR